MNTLLQTILFPNPETCSAEDCYFRRAGAEQVYNTYFNIFSLKKWRWYTDLKSIALHIKIEGSARIRLWAYTVQKEQRLLSEILISETGLIKIVNTETAFTGTNVSEPVISKTEKAKSEVLDPGASKTCMIPFPYDKQDEFLWFSFESLSAGSHILSACYVTQDIPKYQPMVAIDICTFHREEYVYRNMEVLERSILCNPENPYRNDFQVYIVDNGQTLEPAKIASDCIHIIPNRNVGGSGGFTRGILEILKDREQKHITHMIFMDDDAVIEPDALIRTIALLSFIKDQYRDACIGGAMHRIDQPYIQHESGAVWNGVTSVRNHEGVDLRKFDEIVENENILPTSYAGWWYACYPLTVVREDNLPLPMFIHCDDMEYGIRNRNNGIIFLNGICVWHNSFEHRRTSALSYYDVRNIMIMNALIYPDGNERAWIKNLWKRVIGDLLRFRYRDVYIKCLGISDFLRGPEYLKAIDPVEKLREVNAMGYQFKPVAELTDDPETLREIREYGFPEEVKTSDRQKAHVHAYPMGIHPSFTMFRQKSILLFEPSENYGMIVQHSIAEMWKCLIAFYKTLRKLKHRYADVRQAYRKAYSAMSSKEFWVKFLSYKLDVAGETHESE
jgi:galactofuranosylgalactofuranosylrhamnosyl-N-acetylglucosaminyl-diphospho-decaprenol beta-1,5/1,6-galactofuranosyltransferase